MSSKQWEVVIEVLEELGGVGQLSDIIFKTIKKNNFEYFGKTPSANIRRIVRTRPNEIFTVRKGLYGLVSKKKELENKGIFEITEKNKNSQETLLYTHSYFQGILLQIGNIKGRSTYIPQQDKNKLYGTTPLHQLASLNKLPSFSYEKLVQRARNIDVIWLNDRGMPSSLFEVENSTDIQNALLKYCDLQDFYTQMYIVADNSRKKDFDRKMDISAFSFIKHRIKFMSYDDLLKNYENCVEHSKLSYTL